MRNPDPCLHCKRAEAPFQDHNMPLTCENVELRGFEPLTSCMPCRPGPSPDGARCRPACRLPAMTVARCGLTPPDARRRWLPTWLPANPLATLITGGSNRLPTAHPRLAADDRQETGGPDLGETRSSASYIPDRAGHCGQPTPAEVADDDSHVLAAARRGQNTASRR